MRVLVSVALAAVLGACTSSPGTAPAPAPDPAPAAAPVPPPAPLVGAIRVCVVQNGALVEVSAAYNPQTGETSVNGRPFAEVYPAASPPYAAGAAWYAGSQPIEVDGGKFARFGSPRVFGIQELRRAGEFQGVPLFVEAGVVGKPTLYLVPVRPGCEFQPYRVERDTSGVRRR